MSPPRLQLLHNFRLPPLRESPQRPASFAKQKSVELRRQAKAPNAPLPELCHFVLTELVAAFVVLYARVPFDPLPGDVQAGIQFVQLLP